MEAAAPAAGRIPDPEHEGPLRRAISRRMLFFFILGDILGAGIYALVGAVAGTTALAMILISIGKLDELAIVTVMLLPIVFAGVNVAVLVLRRDRVEHRHFVTPSIFPMLGLVSSLVLFVKRVADGDAAVFSILGVILLIGAALWLVNRYVFGGAERFDPARLDA
jgi:APA family basic amino acid/polyamine antiporter